MKRSISIVLLLCLLLTVFAGCGSDDVYVPTGDALEFEEDYTGPTTPTTVPEEPTDLTLTYYPDKSMNPYTCNDFTNRALFSLIYQGLFSVDRAYEVQPVLCKNYRISEDMRTYTFYIERATFSDGTILTAQDVVASLQKAKESKLYSGRFWRVEEIKLAEDGGITIRLNTPYENFPILLDVPILKASQLDSEFPLGTGPYVFSSVGISSSLRRRANWWCQADMPISADTVSLIRAESAIQIRDNFQFGDLDMVCADPGSDHYADYRSDFELWDCENGIFLYLVCSDYSKVFQNDELRAALTYAIDRELLTKDHYRDFAQAASLPASPSSPYYSSTLASRYDYEPEKFAQAVAAAELAEDTVVTLLVNSEDSLRTRAARAICDMLEDGGLKTELKALSGESYEYELNAWNFDLYLGQTMLSANMDLSPFFFSYGTLRQGGTNDVTAYSLCQQALENHGNYYTLHQYVMDNGLLCPVLFRSYAVYATRGLVTDLTPARDNIFFYRLEKTLEDALLEE